MNFIIGAFFKVTIFVQDILVFQRNGEQEDLAFLMSIKFHQLIIKNEQ